MKPLSRKNIKVYIIRSALINSRNKKE